MDQIKRKIEAQLKTNGAPPAKKMDFGPSPDPYFDRPPDEDKAKDSIKNLLLKIMKPFSPLIKLAILPVHHELTETVKKLDVTNRKLNYLREKLDHDLFKLRDTLNVKIDAVDIAVNIRLDLAFDDIGRIKEYTKLLHSISHNLVVELTKLKIEEENLKIKTRILEKDFEFLGKREKALEEHLLE
ncbi:MAG: hypothetical protein WBE11_00160 [Candidatus Aminicenantaceae bacterium]